MHPIYEHEINFNYMCREKLRTTTDPRAKDRLTRTINASSERAREIDLRLNSERLDHHELQEAIRELERKFPISTLPPNHPRRLYALLNDPNIWAMHELKITPDQQATLCRLIRDEFDKTNEPNELANLTQLMKDIQCDSEHLQMLKDVLIPNEKSSWQ